MSNTAIAGAMPALSATGTAPSLWRTVQAESMTFLHQGQTQGQLVSVLHKAIFQPEPNYGRGFLLFSDVQCTITLLICVFLIVKKQSLGRLWIVDKRDSPYGSFWITNAIFCLLLGAVLYLVAWNLTAVIIAATSFRNESSFKWWWTIPLPW